MAGPGLVPPEPGLPPAVATAAVTPESAEPCTEVEPWLITTVTTKAIPTTTAARSAPMAISALPIPEPAEPLAEADWVAGLRGSVRLQKRLDGGTRTEPTGRSEYALQLRQVEHRFHYQSRAAQGVSPGGPSARSDRKASGSVGSILRFRITTRGGPTVLS